MNDELVITPENFAELKRLYEKHSDNPQDTFVFEGREILVNYAKYLIEYLEQQKGFGGGQERTE